MTPAGVHGTTPGDPATGARGSRDGSRRRPSRGRRRRSPILVDPGGQRQLDQDAVDRAVGVQLADEQRNRPRSAPGKRWSRAAMPTAWHARRRRRRPSTPGPRPPARPPGSAGRRRSERRDALGHRRLDLGGHDLAVEDLRHGGGPGREVPLDALDRERAPRLGSIGSRRPGSAPGPGPARTGSACRSEPLDRQLLHADHGVDGPGEAEVGQVRRPRGRMRSSAVWTWECVPTGRNAPVGYQPMACFSDVASACMSTTIRGLRAKLLELLVGLRERAVDRGHEGAALEVQHAHLVGARLHDTDPTPGVPPGSWRGGGGGSP